MAWTRKDLLGIEELGPDELRLILETAESFKEVATREIKKVPTLRGKTIVLLFYEPSIRTRTSFEIAAKRLSADVVTLTPTVRSATKGESLLDTARNLEAMQMDLLVIRHPSAGAPHLLASRLAAGVINAGDGAHEHPTQALLDLLTIRQKKGRIEGLLVTLVGDLTHSRVARSDIHALTKLGATVRLVGPPTLIPPDIEKLGVEVSSSLDRALVGTDVLIVLRLQLERHAREGGGRGLYFPSLREYARLYGITTERLAKAGRDVLVMHPGPINRGVELAGDVADGLSSAILDQVTNGVAVRMAVLYHLSGGQAA